MLPLEKKVNSLNTIEGQSYSTIHASLGDPSFEKVIDGKTVRRWEQKKLWESYSLKLDFDNNEICTESEPFSFSDKSLKRGILCFSGMIVLAIITLLIIFITPSINNHTTKIQDNYGHDISDAIVIAEKVVKEDLKAPSTAKFCKSYEYEITCSDNSWTVVGWVDAENSFGATIRSNFTVKFTFTSKSKYNIDSYTIR